MKYILIAIIGLIALKAEGQSLFPTQFENCKTKAFFLEGKEIFSKCDLTTYISEVKSNIEHDILLKIKGQITMQIVIDNFGNPCCQSLKNELNGKGQKVDFKQIIDNITIWEVPIKEGKEATVSAIIRFTFDKKQIKIQRLGFNMKTGLIELEQKTIEK